jgi:Leucine-rich repeat (LRR) protein
VFSLYFYNTNSVGELPLWMVTAQIELVLVNNNGGDDSGLVNNVTLPSNIGSLGGSITDLNVSHMGLLGKIQLSEFVSNIKASSIRKTGTLPPSLAELTSLRSLDLSGNALHGDLSMLSALTNLEHLESDPGDLLLTLFTGDLSIFSGLTQLTHLGINAGYWIVPTGSAVGGSLTELSKLTKLNWLDLRNQNVTGSLDDLSGLPQLTYLDLGMDYLGNRISLGQAAALKFPQLSFLDLASASDEPGRWSQLSELTQLTSLSLEDWAMSGRMSDGLSNLSQLTHLDLSTATISTQPGDFSDLTQLTYLDLIGVTSSVLQLSDFSHLTQLTYLQLTEATISGQLADLSNLTQLAYLDMRRCSLGGSIPSSFVRLDKLTTFSVYCNGLTGIVPPLPVFRIPPPANGNPSDCALNSGNSADSCQGIGSPNTFRCPLPPGAKENCGGFCTKRGQLQALPPPARLSL